MSRADLDVRATILRDQGVPFVRARVVMAHRPTSAKAGDEAIIHADGSIEGFVGGTCAETTVRAQSLMLLDSKQPLLLRITPTEEPGRRGAERHVDRAQPLSVGRHPGDLSRPCRPTAVGPGSRRRADRRCADPARGRIGVPDHRRRSTGDRDRARGGGGVARPRRGRGAGGRSRRRRCPTSAWSPAARGGPASSPNWPSCGRTWRGSLPAGCTARPGWTSAPGPRRRSRCRFSPQVVATRPHSAAPDGRRSPRRRITCSGAGSEPGGSVATEIDPVCGMTVAAVETSLHLDLDGRRRYFCGPGCLRAYSANPSGYPES